MRKFTSEIGERRHKSPNGRRAVSQCDLVAEREGAVVQLVRIPACHAVGREFESRPHRKGENRKCFLLCRFQEINLLNDKNPYFLLSSAPLKKVSAFADTFFSLRVGLAPRIT